MEGVQKFMMPDFPIDESEDILQQDENSESDDIEEMREEGEDE